MPVDPPEAGAVEAEVARAAGVLTAGAETLGVRADGTVTVGVWTLGAVTAGVRTVGVLTLGTVTCGVLTLGTVTCGVLTLGTVTRGVLTLGTVTRGVLTLGTVATGVRTVGVVTEATWTAGVVTDPTVVPACPSATAGSETAAAAVATAIQVQLRACMSSLNAALRGTLRRRSARVFDAGKESRRAPSLTGMHATTHCPECGRPAEVRDRFALASTEGRIDHVRTMCVVRHVRTVPAERLSLRIL